MAAKTEQVALVTGASSGIGEAAAHELLGAGFTVYGTSRKAASGEERDGVLFLALDVTDDQSVDRAVREVLGRSGRIDVLVNNAGLGITGAAEETSFDPNAIPADEPLPVYARRREALGAVLAEAINAGDEPSVVGEAIVAAATDPRPKLRYPAGPLARRVTKLRRYAPSGVFDKQI